jgi:hypothetical protein
MKHTSKVSEGHCTRKKIELQAVEVAHSVDS